VAGLACAVAGHAQTSPDAAEPVPAAPSRGEVYAEFKRLYEAGEHAAAVEQARLVVELTEREQPVVPAELQAALMNLGIAQYRAGDYLGAESSYLRVISLIEASGRLASPRLARAHAGLATTYHAARRHDLAVESFDRAIALSRRTEGLFNENQLPLLEKYADSLTELGRAQDALQARRYALRLVERRSGENSLAYARELESLGRWYSRARAYDASRASLKRALDTVEELEGQDSLELIGPLTGIADNARRWLLDPVARERAAADPERSALFHDPVMPGPPGLSLSTIATEGLRALERAATITAGRPDPPAVTVAGVQAQLGDWYQIQQRPQQALPHYRQAWQAASQVVTDDGRPLQEALFGAPVLLYYAMPDNWDRHAERPADEAERRYAELELTVTAQGTTQDISVIADAGDPRLGSQAVKAAEDARYRPRFSDGEPVQAGGIRFLQPFYVLLDEAPPGEAPAADPGPASPEPATEPATEPAPEPVSDPAPEPRMDAPDSAPPQGGS
jgi:tetratricopeptide (TPR) repeat protein